MHDRIQNCLNTIESDHNVRILYACESGSRAWGFHSANSDYDVRFIYARGIESYLRVALPRDVIELPIDELLDASGWDLYKACHLLRRTNPPLLEWLGSPIVYRSDEQFTTRMRAVAHEHFNMRACAEHYLSMTRQNFMGYIADKTRVRRKKYLYALRPLLCMEWVIERGEMPPTRFEDVLDGLTLDSELRRAIDDLIRSKLQNEELSEIPPVAVFDKHIAARIESARDDLLSIRPGHVPIEPLNDLVLDVLGLGDARA